MNDAEYGYEVRYYSPRKEVRGMLNKKTNSRYTYEDYSGFDSIRCEIIDGVVYDMSPAPSSTHQRLSVFLSSRIFDYLKGKTCSVFAAPFDVFFVEDGQDISQCINIIQPDISVICDKSKITEKGCVGAPDMIIEIVSPSSGSHDYVRKLNLYLDHKVREYWIVSPKTKKVMKYMLDGDNFTEPEHYTFQETVRATVLDGLDIDFREYEGL